VPPPTEGIEEPSDEESEERLEEADEELGEQCEMLRVFEGVVVPLAVRQLTAPKQLE
jgi:hypothetical protein